MLFSALLFFSCFVYAQAKPLRNETETGNSTNKPFKVLTSGKQITIQSKKTIRSVMVWTAGGHRIVEQKQINTVSFDFTAPPKENIFFAMIEMEDGKRYTEKIGVK